MKNRPTIALSAFSLVLIALTGCASAPPARYIDLPAARQMQPHHADNMTYLYSSPVSWENYNAVIIDPVAIYAGADHQFGDLSEADKRQLAQLMGREFNKSLSTRYRIVNYPAPNALRVKLTLTGASTNTAVVSTMTRFDLVGLPYNTVQSMRGKEGIFMGSVGYSVEICDAASGTLLKAFISKQYPNAMNVAATVGSLSAAETGIEKGAQALLTQMR